jgi:hypothetical protein
LKIRALIILSLITFFSACSEDSDIIVARNLQQYIDENSEKEIASLIACAANADGNTALNYIFYYPENGATDIRYYETTSTTDDEKDYNNYRRQSLTTELDFGGKLQRFSRPGNTETWCLVTYVLEGKLHISDPIRLKNLTKTTEYSNDVNVDFTNTLQPKFTWEDGIHDDNVIYFQVISDEENDFISGTYTEDKTFQYNVNSNVTLTINTSTPEDLVEDEIYNFTMMGVSEDNWVNLIIKEQFIPRNLQEYVDVNTDKTQETLLAFGASANGNKEITYIYFDPIEGAFEYRFYETENTTVDKTDFTNYRRRSLPEESIFKGAFRRFTNTSSDEKWCLVTYITDGKLHISEPIKTKNNSKATEWSTDVEIDYTEALKPKFTWVDGTHAENDTYFQALTQSDNTFLSGTFTSDKTFQYYNEGNITSKVHTITPPDLILDGEYKFSMYGISEDNWVNLVIQKSFSAK